jgi:broad specificity phosphatase PhoE
MTSFWLIRHALVAENARAVLYGTMDVELCPATLEAQAPDYLALARSLPRAAVWIVTPLQRTAQTAATLIAAAHPGVVPLVEPDLIEQHLGDWQGLPHDDLPQHLAEPAHPFWPLSGTERPPGGESMQDVVLRVGQAMERLAAAHAGKDVVIVSHGGAIRAAVAHALNIAAGNALHLAVQNISLTRLERHPAGWRVVCVNRMVQG